MSSIGSLGARSHHEPGEHDDGEGERAEGRGAGPPLLGRFDEPVHERDDADDREDRADRVERRFLRVPRLRHEELPGDERHEDDRDVHEEHRPVPEMPEEPPARERSEAAGYR